MAGKNSKKVVEEDEIEDVGYIAMDEIPTYNPQYPPLRTATVARVARPAAITVPARVRTRAPVVVPVPAPAGGQPWEPPDNWDVMPRLGPAQNPPPALPLPVPQHPSPPPQRPAPSPPAPSISPLTPLPRAPNPVRRRAANGTFDPVALAHETAAVQVLNRWASNREAADASDAAASAAAANAISSASDPAAAEEARSRAEIDYHRSLALAMLEGRPLREIDAENAHDGGPTGAATAMESAPEVPLEVVQTYGEWQQQNQMIVAPSSSGRRTDGSIQSMESEHRDEDHPHCCMWKCWFCYCVCYWGRGCGNKDEEDQPRTEGDEVSET